MTKIMNFYSTWNYDDVKFDSLVGETLTKIEVSDDKSELIFYTKSGRIIGMTHFQDCCEDVYLDDICGNLDDLIGTELFTAEESTNQGECDDGYMHETWTFYKLATINGSVTLRWYGTSNGYYSESVDFIDITSYINEKINKEFDKTMCEILEE